MAQYKRNWGSVSTDFRRTTGFQSETKRISKQAEDQFRKEKDQLASMKEVAAHNSRAERSAASFADKAANHELQALSKFSGKLNTFLQGTAAKWAKEEKAKDINRKIDQIKKDRIEFNKKSSEIRSKIAAAQGDTKKQEKIFEDARTKEDIDREALETAVNKIAENNTAVQQLQKDLEAHNLLNPNDPNNVAKLSGNEKIAYYAVTAEQKVQNAEAGYNQYITDHGDREVVATWLPKETVKDGLGNDVERHPSIKIKDITTPEGKQYLKDEYRDHVMNDMSSQLGGIKEDYRILLLDEPLTSQLDAIQANEVQQYKKDKHKDLHAAAVKGVENALNGTPPFNSDESLGAQFNSAYASTRSSYPNSGQGSPSDGLDNLMQTALNTVTSQKDVDKMDTAWLNYQRLGEQVITTGPHKGKKFKDAHPNRWDLAKAQEEYGKAREAAKTEYLKIETGIVEGKVAGIEDKITKAKTEAKNEEPPRTLSNEEIKDIEAQEFRNILKDHPTENAAQLIFKLQGDHKKFWTNEQWDEEFQVLGEQYRGVIPTAALVGMPKAIQDELLKKYSGWRVVDQPAAISGHQKEATQRHLQEIDTALGEAEILAGQTKPDHDRSVIVRDLAGDLYEQELNRLVYEVPDEEKLSPVDAGKQARQYVLNMITSKSPTLADGSPNPLYAKRDTEALDGVSVWRTNTAVNEHRARGNRLSSGPMETQWINGQKNYNTLMQKEKGKVDLSKNYLFTAPKVNDSGEVQNIDQIVALLGTGKGGDEGNEFGGHAITETYRKVRRTDASSRVEFLHKQRLAILKTTSPDGDPRRSTLHLTHPELVQAWFFNERENKPIDNTLANRAAYVKERADESTTTEKKENEKDIRINEAKQDKRSNKQRAQDNLNESNSYSGVSLNF